jgi:hypothetical protein
MEDLADFVGLSDGGEGVGEAASLGECMLFADEIAGPLGNCETLIIRLSARRSDHGDSRVVLRTKTRAESCRQRTVMIRQ